MERVSIWLLYIAGFGIFTVFIAVLTLILESWQPYMTQICLTFLLINLLHLGITYKVLKNYELEHGTKKDE